MDEVYATRVVFGASGVVWVQDGHYFTQPGHEFCCQPNGHPTFYSAWGNPIRYDCTNASVYTPADFPDSADTGGSPSSTGDTGNPGDTSDTGVCR